MTQHGVVEFRSKYKSSTFLVNGQEVNHYFEKDVGHELEALTLDDE